MTAHSHRKRLAKRDPIFALIAAHAKALKASDKAEASLARLRRRLDARAAERKLDPRMRLTSAAPVFLIGPSIYSGVAISSPRELDEHVFQAFDRIRKALGPRSASRVQNHEREALAELRRRYDAFLRAHRARRKAVGLTARETAAHVAECTAALALKALVNTPPKTTDGLLAFARYLAALTPSSGPWWALQAGLARLAGVRTLANV